MKLMKRCLGMVLTLALLLMPVQAAFAAGTYDSLIDGVLTDFDTMNARCESAPQQTGNGACRSVELLADIAYILDSTDGMLV